MVEITAQHVKQLREMTGVGMMDCKKALAETNGEMEAAIDWLRTRGLAKAAKKAGRIAAEGLIGIAVSGVRGAIVEVNSETDFVARNEQFQSLVGNIARLALDADGDVAKLGEMPYPGSGRSVSGELTDAIATIGENMNLRRAAVVEVGQGVIGAYMHSAVRENLGKIGILVALESSGARPVLETLGKQIAMHIAATNPLSISADDIDQTVVARERAIFAEQAAGSGKPKEIVDKMVEGRVRKYYEEVTLLAQNFVVTGEGTVGDAIKAAEKEAGAPIKLTKFVRYAIGEGIERDKTDFAAEVAAAAGTA